MCTKARSRRNAYECQRGPVLRHGDTSNWLSHSQPITSPTCTTAPGARGTSFFGCPWRNNAPRRRSGRTRRPSRRREMAKDFVCKGRLTIRAACEVFMISETCYRYLPPTRTVRAVPAGTSTRAYCCQRDQGKVRNATDLRSNGQR